jgi:hypothetical protein
MSFFSGVNNPGIDIAQLTTAEVELVQQLVGLGDPNADRVLFWDDSAGSYAWLEMGANLSITGTTLNATGGSGSPGGSDTQVQFNDGGAFAGDSEFTWNKTNNTLTFGDSTLTNTSLIKGLVGFAEQTPVQMTGFERVQFEDPDGNNADWSFRVAADSYSVLNFGSSGGTLGTPTAFAGTYVGIMQGYAHDGTNYEPIAAINFELDGTVGNNDTPGRIAFVTTQDGTNVPTSRIQIDNVGNIKPTTSDTVALGTSTRMWSDLFLASGAVINFNAGNATITHSAGLLTSNVDIAVPDEAYGVGWNGSTEVPTKNAIYDKIETISGATPGGSDTQVQFNDSSTFGGDAGLTYNKTTDVLTVGAVLTIDGPNADISTPNSASGAFGISLTAGLGTAGNARGGIISLSGGDSFGSGRGGDMEFLAGEGGATGDGGFINFIGGQGGATSGNGGGAFITAGSAQAGNSSGGWVILEPGTKTGSGTDGVVAFRKPGTTIDAKMVQTNMTADRDFTFPDSSGTITIDPIAIAYALALG